MSGLKDVSRCAIHTITTKSWSLQECVERYAAAGVGGIGVWRDAIAKAGGVSAAARIIKASGLAVPSLVRGGFFVGKDADTRRKAVDENKVCIDEAAAIGADQVVLVCGAVPGIPLADARRQVADGLAAVLPYAEQAKVKLAIEPLHPMYAGDRSCINRMADARAICSALRHPLIGIALDVFHVWWDPDLEAEIESAGQQGTLFGYHVCDWKPNFQDPLNDRGLMGEGCIDLRHIRNRVEAAGWNGFIEVEIFSNHYWSMDPDEYFNRLLQAFTQHV